LGVSLAQLAERAGLGAGMEALEDRRRWAAELRAPVQRHHRAWAWVSSKARRRAAIANRRAAKTESIGREALARMIERRGYTVWVLSEHLVEYTRNWLQRKHDGGAVKMLDSMGVPYKARRDNSGAIVELTFPWHSGLYVLPAANYGQLDNARGGSFDLLIADEAQKIPHLREWLTEVLISASKDRRGEIVLCGTPGIEVGSLFHEATETDHGGFEAHRFYCWDNPYFGDSYDERYASSTVATVDEDAPTLRVTAEQVEQIRGLTQEQAEHVQDHVKDLPQDLLMEEFGVWVKNPSLLVFPTVGIADEKLYWGPPWADAEGRHCIEQEPEAALLQPQAWGAVFAELPRRRWNTAIWPKRWTGLIGCDLGHDPDAYSLWAGVYSSEDEALREIDAFKCLRLTDDQQFAALRAWVEAMHTLCEGRLGAVVIDASGPAASMGAGWRKRLTPYLPEEAIVTAPDKTAKYAQIKAFNADTAHGKILLRRHSPTDVERRYLWWQRWDERYPSRRRDIDKHRRVHIGDGHECMPGDHALDACRYAWWHSFRGPRQEDPPPPLTPAEIEIRQYEEWQRRQEAPAAALQVHSYKKRRK
jgi:hypothetical protein